MQIHNSTLFILLSVLIKYFLSEDLKIPEDDLIQAIHESISYAYEIEQHQINVTDMTAK
jgi:hypothetical protein